MLDYDIYLDHEGRWRWRLVAANGDKVAASGQSFAVHANALRSARLCKLVAGSGRVPNRPTLVRRPGMLRPRRLAPVRSDAT
jgi:uncharacterized protein YegP (UPF0339 family)